MPQSSNPSPRRWLGRCQRRTEPRAPSCPPLPPSASLLVGVVGTARPGWPGSALRARWLRHRSGAAPICAAHSHSHLSAAPATSPPCSPRGGGSCQQSVQCGSCHRAAAAARPCGERAQPHAQPALPPLPLSALWSWRAQRQPASAAFVRAVVRRPFFPSVYIISHLPSNFIRGFTCPHLKIALC